MERQPETRDTPIHELLAGIRDGRIALADFQRDFDWSPQAIRSLLATVLMGWPAGSLLVVAGSPQELEIRPFDGGPPVSRDQVDLVILDGQQRLTALLRVLAPEADPSLGVPLSAFKANNLDEIEDALGSRSRVPGEDRLPGMEDPLIPLASVRTRDTFTEWRATLVGWEQSNDLGYALANAYRDHLHWLHDYRFPVVTLDSSVPPGSVARIFERVNRTGLRLGSFDLVVARTHSAEWHLRERWEDARLEFPLLEAFYGDDGLPILQAIALQSRRDVRQAAILDLDAEVVLNLWQPALEAMDAALRFLVLNCGVVRAEWLPYRALPLVLGGLELEGKVGNEDLGQPLDACRDRLVQWALSRSFALRYDAAVNTRVVEDFRELIDAIRQKGSWPEVPAGARSQLLVSTKQRFGALFRAFACVLTLNDAQDLLGRPLRIALVPVPEVQSAEAGEPAIFVPLLPRDEQGRQLRSLNMVLAHPDSAREIHGRVRFDAHSALPVLIEDVSLRQDVINSQLLPELRRPLRAADDLLDSRLSKLSEWLRTHVRQILDA